MKKSELGNRVTLFVSRVPANLVFFQLPLPPPPPILRLVKRNGVTKLAERLPYIPPKALYSEKHTSSLCRAVIFILELKSLVGFFRKLRLPRSKEK